MILLAALLFSFLIAILTGGKLSRLAGLPMRRPWLALLAFGMQIYQIHEPTTMAEGLLSLHTAILVLSYLILLLFVWLNRKLLGILIVGVGLVLNFTVMLANGGYMPITLEAVTQVGHLDALPSTEPGARLRNTKDVVLPREQTRLWILSDIFVIPEPFPIPSVFSIGDVFIAAGAGVLVFQGTRRRPAQQPDSAGS